MEAHLSEIPITIYVHDFEVDIGAPEHLESRGRRTTIRIDRSFEDFIGTLMETVDDREGSFRELQSDRTFKVQFMPDEQIQFETESHIARIEVDDLRSIWVKLLKGVVTARAARWDSEVTGEQILSLLSELQDVRAVQIRRRTSERPEIAVELRHRRGTQLVADLESKKPELAWG